MIARSWTSESTADPADLVRIRGLCVDYGSRRALDHVTLRVPAGEVFGLLGPNGAGKTTAFRVLATLLQPTRGEVFIGGIRLADDPREIRSFISYMPDLAPLPSDLRALEYLRFFAEAHGMRGKARDARVGECLEAVGLLGRQKDLCTRLSLGMRQRLALAKALLHRPRVLILDEPASGLDPLARVDLRNTLRRQAEAGATVILSSHVAAEIQDLCTSIGLLHQGVLLDAGPLREVLAEFGGTGVRVVIEAPGRIHEVAELLRRIPGVDPASRISGADTIEIVLDEAVTPRFGLFSALGEARIGIAAMHARETSIEEVLIHMASHDKLPA